jgi:hypothetical protein
MGVLDLVGKAAKGAKKAAPFFSKADVVLDELPRGKGLGNEFLGELVKKGAKPTELRERGIEKALKDKPKMTKAEVQKIFESKPAPKVQEKVLTGEMPDYDQFLEQAAQDVYGRDYWELNMQQTSQLNKMYDELPTAQYDKYKTPGGENYREILLKLPSFDSKRLMELEADIRRSEEFYRDPMSMPDFRAKMEELAQLKEQQAALGTPYTSGHYRNDPNLLAHIRVQDFKTPEGKKVLLVDEVQSDWHQAGRRKGYATGKEEQDYIDYLKDLELKAKNEAKQDFISEGVTEERAEVLADRMAKRLAEDPRHLADYFGGDARARQMELHQARMDARNAVPDAPFKKNWHELAMKRVLDYAAENGYDSIAITPGAEQAKRYDLSKHIDELIYSDDGSLYASYGGKKVFNERVPPENLADYVGKEAAEKLMGVQPNEVGSRVIGGLDLQVGGEGMKGFYDKILPDYLNNFGKQYGSSVGQIQLPTGSEMSRGASGSDMIPTYTPTMQGFHSFDITPQLRDEVKAKGLPLYSKTGMGPEGLAAGSGAATIGSQMFDENNEQQVQNPVHFTENPDAMLLELMQRN